MKKNILKFIGGFLIILILIILVFIGMNQYNQNQKVDNFFSKVYRVEIISYSSRINWKESDRLKINELHLIIEKSSFKEKYIKDRILLSEDQKNKLIFFSLFII